MDPTLNIHCKSGTSDEEMQSVVKTFAAWFKEGETGTFPPGFFSCLYGTSVEPSIFRAHYSGEHTDLVAALTRLGRMLDSVIVERIVVGQEVDSPIAWDDPNRWGHLPFGLPVI